MCVCVFVVVVEFSVMARGFKNLVNSESRTYLSYPLWPSWPLLE